MIEIRTSKEFDKDFKHLSKKYPSLEHDFEIFKQVVKLNPTANILIEWLGVGITLPVYKVKKFACKSLKSTTKLRLIYVYDANDSSIEIIEFIEFYTKSEQELENRERIKNYFK